MIRWLTQTKQNRRQPMFMSFDSLEQMQAYMREQEARANANTRAWQKALTWGDCFVRIDGNIIIFSETFPLSALTEMEVSAGSSRTEAAHTMEMLREARERGYLYGQHYSVLCPEGEWGSCHVSTVGAKISRAWFLEAKAADWNPAEIRWISGDR